MQQYNGILIADLHIGAIDITQLKLEVQKEIIDKLEELGKVDFIIFLGDFWNSRLFINDRGCEFGFWLIDKLTSYTKVIRIIYGTESHDVGQYVGFHMFEIRQGLDFKVIYSVTEEELLPGMKVLYLPEEYVTSKKEYYGEYFDKKNEYDYIFGHGTIIEGMTMVSKDTVEKTKVAKPAKFTTADFKKCCKGEVYFGHYHVHTTIQNFVTYVGSFSRWEFSQEEPKGYYIISFTPDKKHPYHKEFIENNSVREYTTYTFGYDHHIFTSEDSVNNTLITIENLLKMHKEKDHVKFIFNIPEDYENPEFFMDTIRGFIRGKDNVGYEFVNGYVAKKKKVNKEELSKVISEYGYVFDKNLTAGGVLSKFIEGTTGTHLDGKEIDKYLVTDVMELINAELEDTEYNNL